MHRLELPQTPTRRTYSLNNGIDPKPGAVIATPVKHLTEMTDFEDPMNAWEVTVREFQRHAVTLDSARDIALEENVADILCSALSRTVLAMPISTSEPGRPRVNECDPVGMSDEETADIEVHRVWSGQARWKM